MHVPDYDPGYPPGPSLRRKPESSGRGNPVAQELVPSQGHTGSSPYPTGERHPIFILLRGLPNAIGDFGVEGMPRNPTRDRGP